MVVRGAHSIFLPWISLAILTCLVFRVLHALPHGTADRQGFTGVIHELVQVGSYGLSSARGLDLSAENLGQLDAPLLSVREVLHDIAPDVAQIIGAASSTDLVYERVAYIADTFGPRFSGTPGLEQAIDHIKAEMLQDGLSVTEEPVMVPRWVRGSEHARLISPRNKTLTLVGLGDSISTGGRTITAPVLVVSSFADLNARSAAAVGKIVVFNAPFVSYGETVRYREGGAPAAAAAGAVAALVRSVTPFGLQTVHAGTTRAASIPVAAITVEDAELLARMQKRGQQPIMELYMEAHKLPDVQSRNLIVEIKGSERLDEVVLFGGHIDSWDITDGAIDDLGGAVITWELSPPRRNPLCFASSLRASAQSILPQSQISHLQMPIILG